MFDTLSIVSTWASKGSGRDNLSVWGRMYAEFKFICRSQPRVISLFTLLINAGLFIILHCQQISFNLDTKVEKKMPFQPE